MSSAQDNSISIVCFDIGNVLVKLGPSLRSVITVDKLSDLDCLLKTYGNGHIESVEFFIKLRDILNWGKSLAELKAYFVERQILGLQPGVRKLFRELKMQHIPIALMSNTNAAHWERLAGIPEFKMCDTIILSFEQQCSKPDEAIYRALENESGFSGRQILFFDDVEQNIIAARKLQWRAELVDPLSAVFDIQIWLRSFQFI